MRKTRTETRTGPTRRRWSALLLLLLAILFSCSIMSVEAANPISFCKCVCGSEKLITALPQDNEPIFAGAGKACGACTKQFCLSQNAEICKGVGTGNGDELVTSCFERDSYKDQFVVYLFLVTTSGLLGVAGLKPFVKGFWQVQED